MLKQGFSVQTLCRIFKRLSEEYYWPGLVPDKYVCIDLETSGLHAGRDRILQIGLTIVENKQPRQYTLAHKPELGTVPYLSYYMSVDPAIVTPKITEINRITPEMISQYGIPQEQVLPLILSTLETCRDNGYTLVGHNFIRFDLPFLEAEMRMLGYTIENLKMPLVDTGMIVKALQLPVEPTIPMSSWFRQIAELRAKGIYYALDRTCVPTFDLTQYGANVSAAHDAGYDCWVTHLLLNHLADEVLQHCKCEEKVEQEKVKPAAASVNTVWR